MARPHAACFLLAAILLPVRGDAQTTPCDPRLKPPPGDPEAYVPRDGRCEGVYLNNVAGGGLSIVAFTRALKPFSVTKGQPVRLMWSAPSQDDIRLRAVSLRANEFYRMDARRPGASSRFDWPSNVLTALKLSGGDIGLVAWTRSTIGGRAEDVYVPLNIGGSEVAEGAGGPYAVTVVPGAELRQLYVTLSGIDANGRSGTTVIADRAVNRGPYPAEYPIRVRLPPLPAPGVYRLELSATLQQGAPSARTVYFRHTDD